MSRISGGLGVFCLLVACQACSLDFDALRRGRRDGGGDAMDASTRDAATDIDSSVDAGDVDASEAEEDAASLCPGATPDCADPRCAGRPCDDGFRCTSNDVCSTGLCRGTPVECPTDGCTVATCEEDTGECRAIRTMPDATICAGGRCCFGRCSMLRDSGNCAGCGLSCEEESCSAETPSRCVCVTNAGCPLGQQCLGGRCSCMTNAQCATGQTCVVATGHCTY
ncbi:hypothetical protein [Sandaracinus amylolyticus]|uniref:hypothetical protein n=1 Tax=Sandaracinus amylolyticus TaxID=927083 RepID=UPI001F2AF7EA|nr:hypothetical protein [Sandaracinus amylolyticus]UJR82847.1 Hypothetical protein I5071_49120 [Sandaracinus amylolyticus]